MNRNFPRQIRGKLLFTLEPPPGIESFPPGRSPTATLVGAKLLGLRSSVSNQFLIFQWHQPWDQVSCKSNVRPTGLICHAVPRHQPDPPASLPSGENPNEHPFQQQTGSVVWEDLAPPV